MKIIENKCTGATLIEWQKLKDLQPQNLKVPYHTEKIKKSIVELGFANPFDVWINPETNEMLIADGHGRKDVLLELIADGFQVPNELPCTFLDNTKIKTEQEAIKYLLRVFNVKRNPMDDGILAEWVETMDLSVEDVCFEELDIKFETDDIEAEKLDTMDPEKVAKSTPQQQVATPTAETKAEDDMEVQDMEAAEAFFIRYGYVSFKKTLFYRIF